MMIMIMLMNGDDAENRIQTRERQRERGEEKYKA